MRSGCLVVFRSTLGSQSRAAFGRKLFAPTDREIRTLTLIGHLEPRTLAVFLASVHDASFTARFELMALVGRLKMLTH
jgi:hypothetical protein